MRLLESLQILDIKELLSLKCAQNGHISASLG